MRIRWPELVVLAAIGSTGLQAGEGTAVSVCISDPITPTRSLQFNKALVSKIFERAGIQIDWKNCRDTAEGASTFAIHVLRRAPSSASPEALASTRLSSSLITVFHDRVEHRLRRAHPAAAKVASAYVIAHELGHAMQGIPRHSATGILKAEWSNGDFTAMLFNELRFTDFDTNLILQGLTLRRADFTSR